MGGGQAHEYEARRTDVGSIHDVPPQEGLIPTGHPPPAEVPEQESFLDQAAQAFRFWSPEDGPVLAGIFAFDSETVAIDKNDPRQTPDYVLGAAYDGEQGYFVTREHLQAFLDAHPDNTMIMHHATFDLAVLNKATPDARVYDRVDRNRVYDTQLLHRLLTLATEGHTAFGKGQATLEHCVEEYLGLMLPKDAKDSLGNDIRTSYAQWLHRDPREIEPGYLQYAALDAVATFGVYRELQHRIVTVLAGSAGTWGYVSPDWLLEQVNRWGGLSHHIQLKAAIVLAEITRNGLHLDQASRDERLKEVDAVAAEYLAELQRHGYQPGPGSATRLQEMMKEVASQNPDLKLPHTSTGRYRTDGETLTELAGQHPFCRAMLGYKEIEKLKSAFLDKMNRPVLHPSFDLLKTTGRTSSFGDINAQNLPRDDRIRACFIPSPDHVFIDADYSTVELATLAQSCLRQFGLESQMAAAINAGQDLHRLVAAQVTGKSPEEVTGEDRQAAKAINFGKPGGMGDAAMKSYAKATYGADLTDAEVARLTDAWFAMFPEMRSFLEDDSKTGRTVAEFFGLTPLNFAERTGNRSFLDHPDNAGCENEPHRILGLMCIKVLGRVEPHRTNGSPYPPEELDYFWGCVASRQDDLPREVRDAVQKRQASPNLRKAILKQICRDGVFTLTGRLRANATYTARHNTVFQGLASDGAKLALWRLWRAGYRIVNFVHDEVLVEVPETDDLKAHAERIRELMIEGMKDVVPDVRVDVEYAATARWYKKAKAVFHPETGALLPWTPEPAPAVAVQ